MTTANSRSPTSSATRSADVAASHNSALDLVDLLAELGEHGARIVPVETDRPRLLLKPDGAGEGRQALRPTPSSSPAPRPGLAARRRPLAFLLRLDPLPNALGLAGRTRFLVTEHVRMPPDHLGRDRLDDIGECEGAGFLRHARVVDDLQQQIAKLFPEVDQVAAGDRLGHFVGFLDRVRGDGGEVCSLSQGQPVSGSRSAAMISISRPISREGSIPNASDACKSRIST